MSHSHIIRHTPYINPPITLSTSQFGGVFKLGVYPSLPLLGKRLCCQTLICCVFFQLLSHAFVIIPFAPVILMSLVVSDSVSESQRSWEGAGLNPETPDSVPEVHITSESDPLVLAGSPAHPQTTLRMIRAPPLGRALRP